MAGKGEREAAEAHYRKVLELKPEQVGARYNLGVLLAEVGRAEEAMLCYRQLIEIKEDFAYAHNNLGNLLKEAGLHDAAIECYLAAIRHKSDYLAAYNNLSGVYASQLRLDEAFECCRRVLEIEPNQATAYNNLGNILKERSQFDQAQACFEKALALQPDFAEAHNNLGCVYMAQGDLGQALTCFERALVFRPDRVNAYFGRGDILKKLGRLDQALESFDTAISRRPELVGAFDGWLLCAQYSDACTSTELFARHRDFSEQFEAPLVPHWRAHGNSPEARRRIRIGYVSPDFNWHAVAYFIEPLLARRNRSEFEVFCYYNNLLTDSVTERISALADRFVPCAGMTDESLAERIRSDGIDILVDLAGHTAGNRLLTFARKPAPVQATWLGYPNTTGLRAMDYRLTDRFAEPEGMTEHINSERLYRLPDVFCCYTPCANAPERAAGEELRVRPTPALENGYVTFGCFNNYAKITPPVVELWSKLLHAIPNAKLMLEAGGLCEPFMQEAVKARFAAHGIGADRLMLLGRKPEQQYVLYHRIDIALDPFPCNGGTTSFDALWMGVPLVTLAGKTFVSRMGVSFLSNLGLEELIAGDEVEYVEIGKRLAGDVESLNRQRLGLRERMEASPLMDADRFVRNLEAAYRDMWRTWCARDGGV